jgi:hypothetical protein
VFLSALYFLATLSVARRVAIDSPIIGLLTESENACDLKKKYELGIATEAHIGGELASRCCSGVSYAQNAAACPVELTTTLHQSTAWRLHTAAVF